MHPKTLSRVKTVAGAVALATLAYTLWKVVSARTPPPSGGERARIASRTRTSSLMSNQGDRPLVTILANNTLVRVGDDGSILGEVPGGSAWLAGLCATSRVILILEVADAADKGGNLDEKMLRAKEILTRVRSDLKEGTSLTQGVFEILLCSHPVGRIHLVRSLQPRTHLDTDVHVLEEIGAFVGQTLHLDSIPTGSPFDPDAIFDGTSL